MSETVCLACEVARRGGDTAGLTHTCPDSGTWLAAEGRDNGEDADVSLGSHTVTLSFRIQAVDAHSARAKLTGLVTALLDDDLVQTAELFVSEQEVAA